jgi:hypothetical protein
MMKNEQSLESLHDQLKAEEKYESSSSQSEFEEIETKIIALDCSSVHVLTNALKDPFVQITKSSSEKKVPTMQTFLGGQPPLVSINQTLANRIFCQEEG